MAHRWIASALALVLGVWLAPSLARAAEDKIEKLSSDQTQKSYTRKSITYLGMELDPGVSATPEQLAVVEKTIRKAIEIERFDYNAVDASQFGGMDGFVAALREYVKARAVDRAAADAEYELRFKSARVYAQDVDRIMNSAYMYVIKVIMMRVGSGECTTSAIAMAQSAAASAALEKCAMCVFREPVQRAKLAADVYIYRANLSDPSRPAYTLEARLRTSEAEGFEAGASMGQNPLEASRCVAAKLSAYQLVPQLKRIPAFQVTIPVVSAVGDEVEFMAGKETTVRLDDTYRVVEFDAAGATNSIGWVKVRRVGQATGSGEGTPTMAEVIKHDRKFVGGELLLENPMAGYEIGLFGQGELVFKDLLGSDDMKFMGGGGILFDADLANKVGWPEFYFTAGVDFLWVGTDGAGNDWVLDHLVFGVKKKWYLASLALTAGLQAGASFMWSSGTVFLGFGGDAVLGAEYYVKPGLLVYLRAAGRFFGWALANEGDVSGMNQEMAVQAQLGVMLQF